MCTVEPDFAALAYDVPNSTLTPGFDGSFDIIAIVPTTSTMVEMAPP